MLRSSRTWCSTNAVVSCMKARRRFSSNSGKMFGSGSQVCALRTPSHWLAKLSTSERERGSRSMRVTWRDSSAGARSCPCAARSSSVSSGMLFHRKNDRRDASSKSLSR